jgi:hypothetical protein
LYDTAHQVTAVAFFNTDTVPDDFRQRLEDIVIAESQQP